MTREAITMTQEIFVDGVLGAGFSGGALRLDFYSISPEKKNEKTPRVRLVLTPEGFTGCCKAMEGLLAKLVQAGVVRPDTGLDQTARQGPESAASPNRPRGATPSATPPEPDTNQPRGDTGVSPNF
ncbi:hypothetical protein JCM15519_11440 [Fundidesulfovibrio butyratiphilus]